MVKCIFCQVDFDPKANKPEHILLDCLGGRKKTREVDCSACNGLFGKTIDKAVGQGVQSIRNILNLKSGSSDSPATLRSLSLQSGEKINLLPNGEPEYVKAELKTEPLDENRTKIFVSAPNIKKLTNIIPNATRPFSGSDENTIQQIEHSGKFVKERGYIDEHIKLSLSLGGDEQIRSHLKSILCLWALHVGNDEVLAPAYQTARDYVFHDKTGANICQMDHRDFPYFLNKAREHGEIWNMILVQSNENGRVQALFRLYNSVSWLFEVGHSDQHKNLTVGLISNPQDNAKWDHFQFDNSEIPAAWFKKPNSNPKEPYVLQYAKKYQNEEWTDRAFELARTRLGIKEGSPISPEQRDRILNLIIEEFMLKESGQKQRVDMQKEEVVEHLLQKILKRD